MKNAVKKLVENEKFQGFIIIMILLNALSMGLDTFAFWQNWLGRWTVIIDQIFVWIFLIEVLLKLFVYSFRFFKDGWNVFDFIIVGISLVPGNSAVSCFRAIRTLRIFRTARLFGRVKNLRMIVNAMLKALPNLGWLFLILMLIFYIFAVFSTTLFKDVAPDQFGSLFTSFYSLFSLMTMEGWQDTVDAVNSPYARWVFIPFILISSYIFLNLVVGVIIAAMEEIVSQEKQEEGSDLESKIDQLSSQLDEIKALLKEQNAGGKDK